MLAVVTSELQADRLTWLYAVGLVRRRYLPRVYRKPQLTDRPEWLQLIIPTARSGKLYRLHLPPIG